MKRVLVTGASGFVGRALCAILKKKGYIVRAVSRNLASLNNVETNEQVLIEDIISDSQWNVALHNVDYVIHLAARVHVMHRGARRGALKEFRLINRDMTEQIAFSALKNGVERFIFISSIKVNGESTGGAEEKLRFSESDEPNPQDPYAVSKWEAEQVLTKVFQRTVLDGVIIRPPLVYGPGVKANFYQMMRFINMGMVMPFGAIQNKRSFIALDNLINLIMTCMVHSNASNQVFIAGDGEDLSTTQLLQMLGLYLEKPARLVPVPQKVVEAFLRGIGKGNLANRLCGSLQVDISKARERLDWEPVISVDAALQKTTRSLF